MKLSALAPCFNCKWLTNQPTGDVTCKAFPSRGPELILDGFNDHKKPFKGDNGIQYEKIVEAK